MAHRLTPRLLALALIAGAASLQGCILLTKADTKKGVGEQCSADADCQGTSARCDEGLCSFKCEQNSECPSPSECAGGLCQIPLKVGMIYVGVPQDEGWTLTHDLGLKYAASQLPWLRTEIVSNTFLPDDAAKATDTFIADGAQVVIANSFSLRNVITAKSQDRPDIKFLTCSGNDLGPNLGSYFGRSYQTWYLAGFAAATKSKTKRLGFVGSYVTPEVVRHIDAFTLGAKRAKADIKVEVRWEGFWFDLDPPDPVTGEFYETRLANQLIETGCDVIAHNSDNGRVVEAVEKAHQDGKAVFSVGNDNIDGCKRGPNSCLGVPYWNWGPLYVRLFQQLHRGTWVPEQLNEPVQIDPAQSLIVFGTNDTVVDSSLKVQLGEVLADLAKPDGAMLPFRGPYSVSQPDQRTPSEIGAGESLDDSEYPKMCWFVDGVIMKADRLDPTSEDLAARVPDGTVVIDVNSAGEEQKPDCRQNQ